MALITSKGIVFKTVKYSESSIICDIFTEALGLRSFIISASKSSRTKTNLIQVMNILDLVFYENDADKIHRIKECHLNYFYHHLQTNILKSSIGTFMMEICRNTIKEQEENEALFDFLYHWFTTLDAWEGKLAFYHIKFLLDLSNFGGFSPHNNYTTEHSIFELESGDFISESNHSPFALDAPISLLLNQVLSANLEQLNNLSASLHDRNQLLDALIRYYQIHVPGFKAVKSLDILRVVIE